MNDSLINPEAVPDWDPVRTLVMVYPHKLPSRDHLLPFYHAFFSILPEELPVTLLVRSAAAKRECERNCFELGIPHRFDFLVIPGICDIWIRDYAPLVLRNGPSFIPLKFTYAPSYFKQNELKYAEWDNRTGAEIGNHFFNGNTRFSRYIWDLGNLTHNGEGTAIITNQLIADNSTDHAEHTIRSDLHQLCGFENILFIPVEPGDVTGHVDGMVRFIDENVVVVGAYPENYENRDFMDVLADRIESHLGPDFRIIRLLNGIPDNEINEGICSAFGNHMNFLRIERRIYFPYYGKDVSEKPLSLFREEIDRINLPLEVVPVDTPEIRQLARLGGVLNCMTWQVF